MFLAPETRPQDVLDERPVHCDLYWPDATVTLWVGWRKGESNHWLYIEGRHELFSIDRDLYFRFRSFLMVAGRLNP